MNAVGYGGDANFKAAFLAEVEKLMQECKP